MAIELVYPKWDSLIHSVPEFRTIPPMIVFQEVPNEISLCFCVTGCPLRCEGCHSPELRDPNLGEILTTENYCDMLVKYKGLATNVLFMGGEWYPEILSYYLELAQTIGYSTCLYTGEYIVSKEILANLDYIKVGPYEINKGGLSSKNTNQVFIDIKNDEVLNHKFWRDNETK